MIKNMTWLTFGNAVAKPLWFVFIVVICTRKLGTAEFGLMQASLSLMFLANALTDWGITPFTIREVARDNKLAGQFFTNFVTVRTVLGTVAILAAVGIAWGVLDFRGPRFVALASAGVYVFCLALNEYCRAFYRAFEKLKHEAVSIVTEKFLVVGLGVAAVMAGPRADWVLGGMALGMMMSLLVNVSWLTVRFTSFDGRDLNMDWIKEKMPIAFPMGLVSIFVVVYFRIDLVMVEVMKGDVDAGLYGVAYRIVESMVILPAILVAAVFPRLSKLFADGAGEEFRDVLRKSVYGLGGAAVAVALLVFLLAPWIIEIATGLDEFAPSATPLRILAWVFPLMALNYLMSIVLTSCDDQVMLAWILGFAALFNILANLLLIHVYSYNGAAIATLLTELCVLAAVGYRYYIHTSGKLGAPQPEWPEGWEGAQADEE